jgi:hypothetical protein
LPISRSQPFNVKLRSNSETSTPGSLPWLARDVVFSPAAVVQTLASGVLVRPPRRGVRIFLQLFGSGFTAATQVCSTTLPQHQPSFVMKTIHISIVHLRSLTTEEPTSNVFRSYLIPPLSIRAAYTLFIARCTDSNTGAMRVSPVIQKQCTR